MHTKQGARGDKREIVCLFLMIAPYACGAPTFFSLRVQLCNDYCHYIYCLMSPFDHIVATLTASNNSCIVRLIRDLSILLVCMLAICCSSPGQPKVNVKIYKVLPPSQNKCISLTFRNHIDHSFYLKKIT